MTNSQRPRLPFFTHRFAKIAWIPLLAAACMEDAPAPKADTPFTVSEPGKADDMLPAADKARLVSAFDDAIASAEATVVSLEREIANLEASHAAKQREADMLVARIAAREQELKDQYNRNLVLCVFFPNPAICILATYIANDSTLRSYKQQLEAAKAQQRTIMTNIASYGVKRDAIRAKLEPVRAGKARLLAKLRGGAPSELPPELAGSPETAQAYWRIDATAKLTTAIQLEIGLLLDLRNAAVELAQVLDQSVRTLRALEQGVDQLVQQQRQVFMDHLAAFLTGDPAALAEQWLEEALAARTRELLDALEFPLNEFARFLASRGGEADVEQLVVRLMRSLIGGEPVISRADTPVNIYDLTDAKSPLDVTDTRAITALEVFVDIQHTYIGDLHIWLEKDGAVFHLATRAGGDQDDLVKTFFVTDLQGVTLAGRWTLHVEDQAKVDTGTLRRWELVAR